jgi:hypothetical protein
MHARTIRIQPERAFVTCRRVREFPARLEHHAEIIPHKIASRRSLGRAPE